MSETSLSERVQVQLRALLRPSAAEPAALYENQWSTWGDLARIAAAIESQLAEGAVPHRAPVAVVLRNRPSGLAALLGLLAERRVPVLVSPIQPPAAIAAAITTLVPAAIVVDEADLDDEILAATQRVGALCVGLTDGVRAVHAPAELVVAPDRLMADDVAMIVPTSGTTGPPKPIPMRWTQLPFSESQGVRSPVPPESRPPVIQALSMATITGVMGALRATGRGRPVALLERVDVDQWSRLVERFELRRAGLPPAAMQTMLDLGIPRERLASLKSWQTGSAPLTPELQRRFEQTYGVPVLVAYGATEFGGAVAAWTLKMHEKWSDRKLGSVGRAVDGVDLRVLDEDNGAVLPAGEVGVLSVRVPNATTADVDGWTRTNDRARIDEDGFLFILGRADDVIVRGGFKVPLGELETLIKDHPDVRDAAAVGLPEPRLGQVPAVAVVLVDGARTMPDDIRSWARDRTAPYKVPIAVVVLDSLPMGASHKVNRAALRTMFAEAGSAEAGAG